MVLLIQETKIKEQIEEEPKFLSYDKDAESTNDSEITISEENPSESPSESPSTERRLTWKTKIFYSIGHVYNDLTISIWFAYTLLFFKFQFSNSSAGALLLIGQVAGAVFSPVVGLASDKNPNWFICRYGKRKTWHMVGVIMTTLSVPFTYNRCLGCQNSPEWSRFLYYAFFVIVFQSGWAATQVAHVSMIIDLTDQTNQRITLNVYRQMATVASNIIMYAVTLFVLGFEDDKTITKEDLYVFTHVSYIGCAIGIAFSSLFHIFVKEPELKPHKIKPQVFTVERDLFINSSKGSTNNVTLLAIRSIDELELNHSNLSVEQNIENKSTSKLVETLNDNFKRIKDWKDWLKSFSFWKIAIMYTMAKMFVDLSQVYIPLYLQETLRMPKKTIAIIPFATYFFGFIFSFVAKPISSKFGSRSVIIIGVVFGISTSVWIFFGDVDSASYKSWQIYFVAAFNGISGAALLVSTLALTSDLIGTNSGTGAFVFAAMSFVNKNYNGIVIGLFAYFNPEIAKNNGQPIEPVYYYKYIMVALTGCASIFILIGFITIWKSNYGKKVEKKPQIEITSH